MSRQEEALPEGFQPVPDPTYWALEMFQCEEIIDELVLQSRVIHVPRPTQVKFLLMEGTFTEQDLITYINKEGIKQMEGGGTCMIGVGMAPKEHLVECEMFVEGAFRLSRYQFCCWQLALQQVKQGSLEMAQNICRRMTIREGLGYCLIPTPRQIGATPDGR